MSFSRTLAVALSAALLLGTLSQVLGDATALSADCQDELNQLWSNYTNPAYTVSGCDTSCLAECKSTIETAMYVTDIKSCPLQDDITRCFGYFASQWEDYVEECAVFTVDTSGLPAGSTAEAESEAGAAPAAAEGEAEDEPAEGEAEAEAEPAEGEAEAEAEAEPAEGEAEAEAEAEPAEAEAEPEAEAGVAEGEAEAEPAEAEAGAERRLLAEAEAEAAASSGNGICFPSFKSTEEFTMYLKGEYFTLAYDPPSNTVGIILSTFFWVGLAALGFHLRK
jgi:hypothetical protein